MEGPDHPFALEPGELEAMVAGIREAQAALGDGRKAGPWPRGARRRCTRSRAAAWSPPRDIPAGTVIEREMITVKRPGYGIAPKHLDTGGRAAR